MTKHLLDETMSTETVHDQSGEGPKPPHDQSSYVLVVDDEPVVRQFITRCLEDRGYSVKQAGSASDALEIMMTKPASVVLCDIKMPGHDGLWLTAQVRTRWPQTAVVMTTALDDDDTVKRSRELGAVDYVTKPIAPEQLLRAVRRAARTPNEGRLISADSTLSDMEQLPRQLEKIEAEYRLECPVRCPTCGKTITTIKAVRLLRSYVNFISTLPRRGRLTACPHCLAVIPAELTNF
jgi:CheY-like chemotaxis protein